MASQQLYQLYASNPLTPTLASVAPLQPNDAGATEMGAATYEELCIALGIPFTVKVSLTSAEILALNTTPIQLIAAQGANTVIRPLGFMFRLNYVSSTYSGSNLRIYLDGTGSYNVQTTIYAAGSDALNIASPSPSNTYIPSAATNVPLMVDAAGADPTAGDGSFDIYITYTVITL